MPDRGCKRPPQGYGNVHRLSPWIGRPKGLYQRLDRRVTTADPQTTKSSHPHSTPRRAAQSARMDAETTCTKSLNTGSRDVDKTMHSTWDPSTMRTQHCINYVVPQHVLCEAHMQTHVTALDASAARTLTALGRRKSVAARTSEMREPFSKRKQRGGWGVRTNAGLEARRHPASLEGMRATRSFTQNTLVLLACVSQRARAATEATSVRREFLLAGRARGSLHSTTGGMDPLRGRTVVNMQWIGTAREAIRRHGGERSHSRGST